jgi:putative hydrolase of the HAD superfamily
VRAVLFDLFDTLVDFDEAKSLEYSNTAAALVGRDPEEFHRIWRAGRPARETGPLAPYIESLDLDPDAAVTLVEFRREWSRRLLARPREGAVETLHELRSRGLKTGLITVCSEDVVDVWTETPFAGLFDAEVFSCAVGVRKPDPRMYEIACSALDVSPNEALFVGDGANDELEGAERAGLHAALIHRPGEDPAWPELREWSGLRVTSVAQVLDLV